MRYGMVDLSYLSSDLKREGGGGPHYGRVRGVGEADGDAPLGRHTMRHTRLTDPLVSRLRPTPPSPQISRSAYTAYIQSPHWDWVPRCSLLSYVLL